MRLRTRAPNIICAILLFISLGSCEPSVRDRPYGDLRLGLAKDLLGPEYYLEKAAVVLRRDERGWYVMSTMCTKDLSLLTRKSGPGGEIFTSRYSTSTYAMDGKVLTGPAVKNLPYYEMMLAQSSPGSPLDMLYVQVGSEKTPEWRLPIPPEFTSSK